MTNEEKIRELSRKHQGTITDAQYLQMMYAIEEMAEWKDKQYAEVLAPILIELDELKRQVKSLLP